MFLIQQDGHLVEMREQPYDAEELLQRLLAEYPNLLAGDQINSAAPRRWLLVSREVSVPAEEGGPGRWSLDHLFLDQDGIPTLVEVKPSRCTRRRRLPPTPSRWSSRAWSTTIQVALPAT